MLMGILYSIVQMYVHMYIVYSLNNEKSSQPVEEQGDSEKSIGTEKCISILKPSKLRVFSSCLPFFRKFYKAYK